MDCSFILQNEIHEKYLLGRLNAAEQEEYKQHLEQCDNCRRELERQKELIGGIRAQATLDMKREIKLQAEKLRTERPKQDWAVWYKAAAVILLFSIMPALLYYSLHTGTEPQEEMAEKVFQAQRITEAVPASPEEEKETTTDKIQIKEKKRIAKKKKATEKSLERRRTSKSSVSDEVPLVAATSAKGFATGQKGTSSKGKQAKNEVMALDELAAPLSAEKAKREPAVRAGEEKITGNPDASDERMPVVSNFRTWSEEEAHAFKQGNQLERRWIVESDSGRIIIVFDVALADSLKKNSAIPTFLDYEILSTQDGTQRMIWRGSGAYKKLLSLNPRFIQKTGNRLNVFFNDTLYYQLDLSRQKGRAKRIK